MGAALAYLSALGCGRTGFEDPERAPDAGTSTVADASPNDAFVLDAGSPGVSTRDAAPPPIVSLASVTGAEMIAVNARALCVTTTGSTGAAVACMPLGGSSLQTIGTLPARGTALALSDDTAFVAHDATQDHDGAALLAMPIAGGGPAKEVARVDEITGIVARGDSVYWSVVDNEVYSPGRIARAPIANAVSGQAIVANDSPSPFGLRADDTSLYWATYGGTEETYPPDALSVFVHAAPLGATQAAVRQVATPPAERQIIQLAHVRGYTVMVTLWADFEVFAVPDDGGTAIALALFREQPYPTLEPIASDDVAAYWIEPGTAGRIRSWSPGAPTATTVVAGETSAHGITLDASRIYWTNDKGVWSQARTW